jgi:hypothetical protein
MRPAHAGLGAGGSPRNGAAGVLTFLGWTTGVPQQAGMWIQVELPTPVSLTELQFTSSMIGGGRNGEPPVWTFPRSLRVQVSTDGTTWSAAVAEGEGTAGTMVLTFAPITARFIRFTQIATVQDAPRVRRQALYQSVSQRRRGRNDWGASFTGTIIPIIAVTIAAALIAIPAGAQTLYGNIVGIVKDAQGLVLPGANVVIINTGTNLKREGVTDAQGAFTFVNVLAGQYDVRISLQGFREAVRTGVPVTVGQVSRVDTTLEIGGMNETVTVKSEAELLQTDKADTRTELNSQEVTSLPLNGYRNVQSLIVLVPGSLPPTFQNAETDTPQRSLFMTVNGLSGVSNRRAPTVRETSTWRCRITCSSCRLPRRSTPSTSRRGAWTPRRAWRSGRRLP